MTSTGRSKRVALIVLLNLVILECCCAAVLLWARSSRSEYFSGHFDRLVRSVDQELIESVETTGYDAHLGWDRQPNQLRNRTNSAGVPYTETYDELGARTNAQYAETLAAASYGDSHTVCSEVNDDETWQYYLSRSLEANVRNFGVGGYGPGQALLKLERHFEAGIAAPVVILGVHEENLNRALNTYRPFYLNTYRSLNSNHLGSRLAFKPRFVVEDGGARVEPNPLRSLSSVDDLLTALEMARHTDYWYQFHSNGLEVGFPFSLKSLDLLLRVLDRTGILKHPTRSGRLELHSLWNDSAAVAVMAAITERYVQLARERGFRAVLLFLPALSSLRADRSAEPGYRSFAVELRQRYEPSDLVVLEFPGESIDLSRFSVRHDGGHASAYGNQAIAQWLEAQLGDTLLRSRAGDEGVGSREPGQRSGSRLPQPLRYGL
ncbi:MAG TPA: hypothetical protein DIU15_11595 [Deltaproteobacteria bacterium]|nr:hypothetical protein [Deltaproteobacteria bacterium]